MIELSKAHKSIFEKHADKITSKDEQRVLNLIDSEIKKLEKEFELKSSSNIESLITNVNLLLELLRDEDFPLTESSQKWLVFGLNYLISDFDIIPDGIPGIGYIDDALVISWVKGLLEKDIKRFSFYKKIKELSDKSGLIKEMLQGDGHTEIIIIPGFLSNDYYTENFTQWVQLIKKSKLGNEKPGISILDWKTNYTTEFHNTLLLADHKLNLKPKYDAELFMADWQQLKTDYSNLAKPFYNELKEIKKQSPDKKIILITLNIGSYIIDNSDFKDEIGLIDDYYMFGSCSQTIYAGEIVGTKVKNIYNFFNPKDGALKFIFDNFEEDNNIAGLSAISTAKSLKVRNINLNNKLDRHASYKEDLSAFIDSI